MAYSHDTLKAKYDTYKTKVAATATAKTTFTALGARPEIPSFVDETSDVTTVETAQATYDASFATASAALDAKRAEEKAALSDLIAYMEPNVEYELVEDGVYDVTISHNGIIQKLTIVDN